MRPPASTLPPALRIGSLVGSGTFSAIDPSLATELNGNGQYVYRGLNSDYKGSIDTLLRASAFGGVSDPEHEVARKRFGALENVQVDEVAGYYIAAYAGWVTDEAARARSSSGGLTTWILEAMLQAGLIDGVVHVRSGQPGEPLFQYQISRSIAEIRDGAKSRYFPCELSDPLRVIRDSDERFAVVAIPSIAYEIRLLQTIDPVFAQRIPFVVGLICGHQKTAHYADYLGWRAGFPPGALRAIDFRKKVAGLPANTYSTELVGDIDGRSVTKTLGQSQLYGTDWGYGFFKAPFADLTDDVLNETADVVMGDAWLPRFVADGRGTNVVIVRNPEIRRLLQDGTRDGSLHLEEIPISDVVRSQGSLIRQSVDDLPFRLKALSTLRRPVSHRARRHREATLPWLRQGIQLLRMASSYQSHRAYRGAVASGRLARFDREMRPITYAYGLLQRVSRVRKRFALKK